MRKPSGLELNGVANIDMILQVMEQEINEVSVYDYDPGNLEDHIKSIREQLDTLNRYMTAISKEIHANHHQGKTYVEVPLWHEVRENKHIYKTNGGK